MGDEHETSTTAQSACGGPRPCPRSALHILGAGEGPSPQHDIARTLSGRGTGSDEIQCRHFLWWPDAAGANSAASLASGSGAVDFVRRLRIPQPAVLQMLVEYLHRPCSDKLSHMWKD